MAADVLRIPEVLKLDVPHDAGIGQSLCRS